MRYKLGNGYVEKEVEYRYWRVYKTPIASEPVGGFSRLKKQNRFECAHYSGVTGFMYADTPEDAVNCIINA